MQSIEIPELIRADRNRHIVPESVKKDPELLLKYETAFKENAAEYERLRTLGKSEESLVYYLLSGNTLDIVTTMNARELLTFMKLRTCSRAQWEIRAHAAIEHSSLQKRSRSEDFRYCTELLYFILPRGQILLRQTGRNAQDIFNVRANTEALQIKASVFF